MNYAACESNSTGGEAFFQGADDFVDSELRAAAKIDGLRGFMKLEYGIPSHDTIGRMRTVGDRTSTEHACYSICSLPADAERIARAVRNHWEVESVPQAHSKEGCV